MVDFVLVLAGKISSSEYPKISHTRSLIIASVEGVSVLGSVMVINNDCL